MKKPIIIIPALLSLLSTACHQEEVIPISQADNAAIRRAATRAALPRESSSATNPDLIFDWENVSEITLNTLGNGVTKKRVSAPWNKSLNQSALPDEFCKDIKREDGWTMLFHTFEEEGKNEQVNYMCFYNLFTGYLKVFYFNESPAPISNMIWTMIPGDEQLKHHSIFEIPELLTPKDGDTITLDDKSLGLRLSNAVIKNELTQGWNGFQLQISRYQKYPSDLNVVIGAYGQVITDYNFNGISKSDLQGTITSVSSTDKSVLNSVSKLGTNASQKVLDDLAGKIWKNGQPDGIGKHLVEAAKSLAAGQIGNALKQGVKLLFGRSMWSETNYQVSDVRLTQTGTITVTGTSTTNLSVPGGNLKFNLHDMLIERANIDNAIVSPDWDSSNFTGLGTWTLDAYPVVSYNPVTKFVPTVVHYEGGSEWSIEGYAEFPTIEDYELNVKFNPMIKPYIVDYDVDVDFVDTDLFNDNDDSTTRVSPGGNYKLADHVYYMYPHQERLVMRASLRNESFNRNLNWY